MAHRTGPTLHVRKGVVDIATSQHAVDLARGLDQHMLEATASTRPA